MFPVMKLCLEGSCSCNCLIVNLSLVLVLEKSIALPTESLSASMRMCTQSAKFPG